MRREAVDEEEVRDFKWKKQKKKEKKNPLSMNQPCPFTSEMSSLGFREGQWVPQSYSWIVEGPDPKYHLNTQYNLRSVSPGLLYAKTSTALKRWER